MSAICLFREGSHESQQARRLNKDHCFAAGTKGEGTVSFGPSSSDLHMAAI